MPFVIRGTRPAVRIIGAALGLALLAAPPALAAGPAFNPNGCKVGGVWSNPFTAWGDRANYELAPGGDFETGATRWTRTSNTSIVGENQPFRSVSTGTSSLQLAPGAVATSPSMCIDSTYPFFRLFARNTSTGTSGLKVGVLYLDSNGNVTGTRSGQVAAGSNAWRLTDPLAIGVAFNAAAYFGAAPVRFQFSAGKDSTWRIDDLYIDPYGRG